MPKKKKGTKRNASAAPHFHRDFCQPTATERTAALGPFPGAPHAAGGRAKMIECASTAHHPLDRPSLSLSGSASRTGLVGAQADLDDKSLYAFAGKSETNFAIPKPRDELDWLAQVPEDGQSFEDYVRFLTSRSGRVRPIANAGGEDIVLLPIIRALDDDEGQGGSDGAGSAAACWPAHGPPLDFLTEHTRAFFDRRVCVLPPAVVRCGSPRAREGRFGGCGKKTGSVEPGAFATAKGEFTIEFPAFDNGDLSPRQKVGGRADPQSGRIQLQVASLLDELAAFRENRGPGGCGSPDLERRSFCVMGITMIDLFDGPKDLFCAGMAFGGSKVAVFSFHRYHPHMKMHPLLWHHHGYSGKADSHPYYDDNDQDPAGLEPKPLAWKDLTEVGQADLLRRAGKLLTHELGHLYGLAHCIYHRCLMMGTGHLVEDFASPSHLCGVCLRKLQWRLGFRVRNRYALLSTAFGKMGLKAEQRWAHRQSEALGASEVLGPIEKRNVKRRRVLFCENDVIDLTAP